MNKIYRKIYDWSARKLHKTEPMIERGTVRFLESKTDEEKKAVYMECKLMRENRVIFGLLDEMVLTIEDNIARTAATDPIQTTEGGLWREGASALRGFRNHLVSLSYRLEDAAKFDPQDIL